LVWDIVLVVKWRKFKSILPSFAAKTTFVINGWWSLGSIFFSKFIFRSADLSIIFEISLLYLCKLVLNVISIIIFVFVWIVCVNQIVLIISVFKNKWLSHLCWSMYMIILVVEWRKFETILPTLASEATFVWGLYLSIISVVIEVFIWIICVNQIVIIISVLKN
jgi:hypothetical protein